MKSILLLLGLLNVSAHVSAQEEYKKAYPPPPVDTKLFDAHNHITFKNYYTKTKSAQEILGMSDAQVASKYYEANWENKGAKSAAKDSGLPSHVNYYQSTFPQYSQLGGSLIVEKLYPFEKQFANTTLRRLANHFTASHLSLNRLAAIGKQTNTSFDEFSAEYKFLTNQTMSKNIGGKNISFHIVKDAKDLQTPRNPNTIKLILAIEGGHVFLDSVSSLRQNIHYKRTSPLSRKKILDHVNDIRAWPDHIFFVTLSHFTWNRISGFAKSLDKAGATEKLDFISILSGIRKFLFNKQGEGIYGPLQGEDYVMKVPGLKGHVTYRLAEDDTLKDLGVHVVERLLSSQDGHNPIYIDVKHMDIKARLDYEDILNRLSKDPNYNYRIPIIASHMGVSGERRIVAYATGLYPNFDRYEEVIDPNSVYEKMTGKYYRDWQVRLTELMKHNENPLNLDPVKLAMGKCYSDPYPFTESEMNWQNVGWFNPWSINLFDEEIELIYKSDGIIGLNLDERILGAHMSKYNDLYWNSIEQQLIELEYINPRKLSSRDTNFIKDYRSAEPFLRNLFYIVSHSKQAKAEAWKHVIIGSDFDGLIDPINICPTVADIPAFKAKLSMLVPAYIEIHHMEKWLTKDEVPSMLDKLFFQNGEDFTMKYFDKKVPLNTLNL